MKTMKDVLGAVERRTSDTVHSGVIDTTRGSSVVIVINTDSRMAADCTLMAAMMSLNHALDAVNASLAEFEALRGARRN